MLDLEHKMIRNYVQVAVCGSSQNKGQCAPSADIKLHQEIAEAFPAATIVHIHRKYFKGMITTDLVVNTP